MLCLTMPLVTRHSEQGEESRFHRYFHEFEILPFAQDDSKAMGWLKSHKLMFECNFVSKGTDAVFRVV